MTITNQNSSKQKHIFRKIDKLLDPTQIDNLILKTEKVIADCKQIQTVIAPHLKECLEMYETAKAPYDELEVEIKFETALLESLKQLKRGRVSTPTEVIGFIAISNTKIKHKTM